MSTVIYLVDLGLSEYQRTLRLQHALHHRCQMTGENVLLLTQHYPVVTLGYRRLTEQLCLSAAELAEKGVALAAVARGGGATYHGPGQLVAYPIFSSLFRRHRVRGFVRRLEEVMRRVSRSCGVAADCRPGFPGIWVKDKKLGAVGIAVRERTSLHGCALNVNIDLHPFSYIVPCGIRDAKVTSLERESGARIAMAEVVQQTRHVFAEVFAAAVKEIPDEWSAVERTAGTSPLADFEPA